jgi:hypothetical protein
MPTISHPLRLEDGFTFRIAPRREGTSSIGMCYLCHEEAVKRMVRSAALSITFTRTVAS